MYYYEEYLMHHGVKGMKWGVRRYQNADGTLTDTGKKRQAKIDQRDGNYRQKQLKATANWYDKTIRSGPLFLRKREGINSLQKKLDSKSNRYDKNVIERQLRYRKALKQAELIKVSQLTHDQITREKVAVGKTIVKDALISIGSTAVLLPTTGLMYGQYTYPQSIRSKTRRES